MLHQLSKDAIAANPNEPAKIIDYIVTNLTATYGTKHINTRQDEWVLNNAGGAMGYARLVCIGFFLVLKGIL